MAEIDARLDENQKYEDGKEDIEDNSEMEDADVSPGVRYLISSYGADYPVDGLVKRLEKTDILIPDFQRGFVWSWYQASRFIESLLLGLPVPGIFLAKDPDTQKHYVIDGQQRLMTLKFFYDGILEGKEFTLKGVSPEFERLTYKLLDEDDRRRLDDSIIHTTIVRQEEPENDNTSIYTVFERLNTGGTALSSQEIRNCIYQGEFSELLRELNSDSKWRSLYGKKSKRMKDIEVILRFFALFFELDFYKRPMETFLTNFMANNRHFKKYQKSELQKIFIETVNLIADNLNREILRPERSLNVAVTDAVFVASAHRLNKGIIEDIESYKKAMEKLVHTREFLEKCKVGTTDNETLRGRIRLAKEAVETIP